MRLLLKTLPSVVAVVAVAALAQQQSLMMGADTFTQPDGGIIRRVKVDQQGRIVIAPTAGATLPDGGSAALTVTTFSCPSRNQTVTTVGTSPVALPTTLAYRWMVRVCNSPENAGTPLVKCRDDNSNPTMGLANAGEVLEVGDCVSYYTTDAIRCVSNSASVSVTQAECQ
jgi:hypothetical protein